MPDSSNVSLLDKFLNQLLPDEKQKIEAAMESIEQAQKDYQEIA
jgi:hypothetical protein